jgi:YVTN family beta-propeller protein
LPLRREAREGAGTGTSQKTCRCGGASLLYRRFYLAANGDNMFFKPIIFIKALLTAVVLTVAGGCMDYGPAAEESFDFSGTDGGVFILHEGRFMYGEASLSFYLPSGGPDDTGGTPGGRLENEVFARANAMKLGDVAQSMIIRGGQGYIAVNNSGVIFVIDIDTFLVTGIIRGIPSPRYIHFVSDAKAYVTSIDDPRITIFDPRTLKITGHIDTGAHDSTEQMAAWGKYLFVTCWSYDNTILVIDTETDAIVDSITTGIQPRWITADRNGRIWALTDGGYNTSSYGYETPALYRIDPASRSIEKEFRFSLGNSPRELAINGAGDELYFIDRHVYRMPVRAEELPREPFHANSGTIYYSLGVDPRSGEVYLGDAVDYSQQGVIYRLNTEGDVIDTLRTGIIPTSFCFRYE